MWACVRRCAADTVAGLPVVPGEASIIRTLMEVEAWHAKASAASKTISEYLSTRVAGSRPLVADDADSSDDAAGRPARVRRVGA